jgi:hypothetical protein
MLFSPPRFLGTMFPLRGSGELDRKIGVGVGVLGVSGISGSIDRSISTHFYMSLHCI